MTTVVLFFATILVSLLACWLVIRYAPRLGLLDQPGGRKMHSTLVPRAGGFAIIFTYVVFALATRQSLLTLMSLGAVLVYVGGFYDDHRPANTVLMKLAFQFLGALIATLDLYLNHGLNLGLSVVCFGFILFMINAFNLMDNMNGLTAGMTAVLLAAFCVMNLVSVTQVVILCGALLGFLILNYPSGRIFLGDQGSQFLGYLTSVFAVRAMIDRYESAPSMQMLAFCVVFLFIAFLPFLLDTAVVTAIRVYNHKPITSGDQNHLSHQLLRRGVKGTAVPLLMVGFQVLCAFGSYAWLMR